MLEFLRSVVGLLFTPCPTISPGYRVGTVNNPDITEASSLTASLYHKDVFWTINDSGSGPVIFGLHSNGDTVTTVNMEGAINVDWEAVETAYCDTESDATCLYVGDIGDNLKQRKNLSIYKVKEPKSLESLVTVDDWEEASLKYPDGEAHDAESLLIDHQTRTLLVITKSLTECRVFTAPLDFIPGSVITLASTNLSLISLFATDASSTFSGDRIVIRSYLTGFLWERSSPGASLLSTLGTADPCVIPVGLARQGESIAMGGREGEYFTHSEYVGQDIIMHTIQ